MDSEVSGWRDNVIKSGGLTPSRPSPFFLVLKSVNSTSSAKPPYEICFVTPQKEPLPTQRYKPDKKYLLYPITIDIGNSEEMFFLHIEAGKDFVIQILGCETDRKAADDLLQRELKKVLGDRKVMQNTTWAKDLNYITSVRVPVEGSNNWIEVVVLEADHLRSRVSYV